MRKFIVPFVVFILIFSTFALALLPMTGTVQAQGPARATGSRDISNLIQVNNGLPNTGQWNTLRFVDLNKDQFLDIVGGSWGGTNGLTAYTSNNGNSWNLASTGLPQSGSYGLGDVGDVNGDGNIDLIVPDEMMYSSGPANGIQIWESSVTQGAVSWTHGTDPVTSGSYSGAGAGDADGDGKLDIAASPQQAPLGLRFWKGDGGNTWTNKSVGLPLTGTYSGVKFADVNKDGRKDIIAAAPQGVKVFTSNTDMSWTDNSSGLNKNFASWDVRAFDINKDGNMDIVATTAAAGVRVFKGNGGNGGSMQWTEDDNGLDKVNDCEAIGVGNVDRDKNPDILTASDWTDFGIELYLGNGGAGGSMSFTQAGQTYLPNNVDYLGADIADFNNDGTGDILVGKGYDFQGMSVWKTIAPVSKLPVANAGPDQVVWVGQKVKLDGTGSTDDTRISAYDWNISSQPQGSTAALSDEANVTPTFTPLVAGDYVFTLQIKDEDNQWALLTDSVTITAKLFPNARPKAEAGPDQLVKIFTKVTLNGSASWDDAKIIAYNWNMTSKPSDSNISLSDETVVAPTFAPEYIGDYKFTLTVEDVNNTWSKDDTVKVTVRPSGNGPPTANAGQDGTIELGDTFMLNGSASTDDQRIVLYHWSVESQPPISFLTLQDVVKQNITPTAVGPYTFTLMVKDNDNLWSTQSDSVTLTVMPKNLDPTAKISSPEDGSTILSTDLVKFDGTQSSDPEGSDLVYQWTSSKDGVLGTDGTFSKNLTIGDHTITLYVIDDHGHKVHTSVHITIKLDDLPVAKLSASSKLVLKEETVKFDGSKSTDAQGPISKYLYDYGDSTNSGWVSSSSSTHQYKTSGKFQASLKVKDGKGQIGAASEQVEIVVDTRPAASLTSDMTTQTTGKLVKFDATGSADTDGTVAQYYFDYGDGTNSGWLSNGTITKAFTTPGTYTVTVKVKDDLGYESTNNAQVSVTVQAPKKNDSGGFGAFLLPLLIVIIIIVVLVVIIALVMRKRAAKVPEVQALQQPVAPPPPPPAYYQPQPQQPQYYDQSQYGYAQQQTYDQQQPQQPAYDPNTYQNYDTTGQQYQQPPQQ